MKLKLSNVQKIAIPIWLILIVLIIFSGLYLKTKVKEKNVHDKIMKTRTYFDWKSMSKYNEKYYNTAVEILGAYAKKMNPTQRKTYIEENKRVADAVGRSRWDGICISYLETSFNPYGKHYYGEKGINGIKWRTALWAETIQRKFMPTHIAKKIRIDLHSPQELHDIKTSIRIAYTLLWFNEQTYKGFEQWVVSDYHWGGFVYKYWKLSKDMPRIFTLDGKKYSVISYYLAFKDLKICFEKGQLEPIANIRYRHQKKKKKLHRRELEYRKLKRLFKGADKKVTNLEEAIDNLKKEVKEYKEYKEWAEKELLKIGSDARKGKAKGMSFRIKQLARDWLKKLKGKKK